ncbi:putative fungal zinc cluster transcription factor [Moniliophthora roreri MCA 2997]|nr:putative fungal zinc cluster transcription factor [Moniliophthora roreri MCA 2997]KAI3613013.1 putative fungal zinc cluster transcription factor [Moniliophthora roreri]
MTSLPTTTVQPQAIQPATTTTTMTQRNDSLPSNSMATATADSASTESGEDGGKKKKTSKRRKVNHACLYCRRSHMTCDDGRPCQRCIKREIGHLCHDERRPRPNEKQTTAATTITTGTTTASTPSTSSTTTVTPATSTVPIPGPSGAVSYASLYGPPTQTYVPTSSTATTTTSLPTSTWPTVNQTSFLYRPGDTLGNEFSVLTDFLETLDDSTFFSGGNGATVTPSLMSTQTPTAASLGLTGFGFATPKASTPAQGPATAITQTQTQQPSPSTSTSTSTPSSIILPSATKTEKFLLTAADQEDGSRDERLSRVIRAKYEAGMLKPYNYVKGYARLSRWMDRNVSQESKQQILQPLSVLRPKFRAVAQSLRDIDLVFIEEAFERLLLDYDRVFSAMGVPACLWRRTGEIYKANREFCELVGVEGSLMREGRLCVYELMAEESAVNYWEKYGHVAFDASQKAVLTSCVLRYKPQLNLGSLTPKSISTPRSITTPNPNADKEESAGGAGAGGSSGGEEGLVNCCFSFTIRRDKWGIPTMIVGNFIKC